LIVIAIIGLISSLVLVSLGPSRERARDAHRMLEIDQFYKILELCYADTGVYPDSEEDPSLPQIWDKYGSGWRYAYSCGPCHGNFENALRACTPAKIEDPVNKGELAYFYFYFEPGATTYNGVSINDACKGHYALMAHLELPGHENVPACFDEPNKYEFWRILSY
jgi:hypothetical protein